MLNHKISSGLFWGLFSFLFINLSQLNAQVENIIVETYYISDEIDATDTIGGGLDSGSVTYRVYVDLAKGSKLRKIFGSDGHPLIFESTENFFNNKADGQTFAKDFQKSRLQENTVALDSWITLGQVTKPIGGKTGFGVLKVNDSDGSFIGGANNDGGSAEISGGLLNNNASAMGKTLTESDGIVMINQSIPDSWGENGFRNPISLLDSSIFGSVQEGNIFSSTKASLYNSGTIGFDTNTNHILIAQLTTKGKLSFELNLELEQKNSTGGLEIVRYLARDFNLQKGDVFSPVLVYPPRCGCMNPDYLEYKSSYVCGTIDSCKTKIKLGCMDPLACNFNQNANMNISQLCCYIGDCGDRDISLVCPNLSFEEISGKDALRIYPNPTTAFINISMEETKESKNRIELLDMQGRIIFSKTANFNHGVSENISVSNLNDGIYLLRIFNAEKYFSGKFIKKSISE